jgi:hypothetical protein
LNIEKLFEEIANKLPKLSPTKQIVLNGNDPANAQPGREGCLKKCGN